MNLRRRLLSLALATVMLASLLAFAGCGGGESTDTSTAPGFRSAVEQHKDNPTWEKVDDEETVDDEAGAGGAVGEHKDNPTAGEHKDNPTQEPNAGTPLP